MLPAIPVSLENYGKPQIRYVGGTVIVQLRVFWPHSRTIQA